ncbi:MAG: HDOD domain-containing protein, partial [Mariprofundaceae bacterium]
MQNFYIGRQAVFDRNYQVVSYELLFRDLDGSVNADAEQMTGKVLVNAMMDIGLDKLVGDKQVHINASERFLLSDVTEVLPVAQVGIEVLEDVPVTEEVIAACQRLKAKGFTILLDDVVYAPQLEPLIELADIIKVDFLKVEDLTEDVRALRKYPVKLLAEKVETYEDYERALALGFDYFQGYFFCKPEVVKGKTMADSKIAILRALQQVLVAADVSEIQNVVKQDVSLSYRLLKYINSPAFAMRREIDSIEQALVLLGLSNVRRWLSLLSLAALGEGKPSELIRSSLYRGYLLESVAKQLNEDETGDDFIMGMFSVLDALLDQDMATALEGMALPKPVRDALLDDSAEMAYKLKMVYALESGNWDEVLLLSQRYRGLRIQDLTGLHLEAMAWADEQVAA